MSEQSWGGFRHQSLVDCNYFCRKARCPKNPGVASDIKLWSLLTNLWQKLVTFFIDCGPGLVVLMWFGGSWSLGPGVVCAVQCNPLFLLWSAAVCYGLVFLSFLFGLV